MAIMQPIRVEISPGELLDRISILEIKSARMADPAKLANVRHELGLLAAVRAETLPTLSALSVLASELKSVNQTLWDVEDAIRAEEAASRFGPRFVALARSVYRHNDRRAAIKRRINELLGSAILEEKDYADYAPSGGTNGRHPCEEAKAGRVVQSHEG